MNTAERKSQLLARRGALLDRLEKIKRDVTQAHSSDFAEQAQERENDEVLDSLGNETRVALSRVNRALELLERGEYGFCEACGQEIAEGRLEVIPDATHCVRCAE